MLQTLLMTTHTFPASFTSLTLRDPLHLVLYSQCITEWIPPFVFSLKRPLNLVITLFFPPVILLPEFSHLTCVPLQTLHAYIAISTSEVWYKINYNFHIFVPYRYLEKCNYIGIEGHYGNECSAAFGLAFNSVFRVSLWNHIY